MQHSRLGAGAQRISQSQLARTKRCNTFAMRAMRRNGNARATLALAATLVRTR